jgi:pyruvate/2-oxoglutarate dehydrogenase complex dihydrolipoamide dehydrogenase (E3) component
MERVRTVIETNEPADSVERNTGLGVDVRLGHARIVDPWTVEIDGGDRVTARSIVVAAGAEPLVPPTRGWKKRAISPATRCGSALRGRTRCRGGS